jgi:Rad3-related DNA helicase
VIPTYRQLVIDEAHHLESEATDRVGYAISRSQASDLVHRVVTESDALGIGGALGLTFRSVSGLGGEHGRSVAALLQPRLVEAHANAKACSDGIDRFFHALGDFMERYEHESTGYDRQLRVTSAARRDPGWSQLEIEWDDLMQPLGRLVEDLRFFDRSIDGFSDDELATRPEMKTEFEVLEQDIEALRERMTEFVSTPSGDMIYWLSRRLSTDETSGHAAPLHVGGILNERLFNRCESVTLTSATLTTDGSFDYIRDRLSLEDADELSVRSPFDYAQTAMLGVTDDVPEPGQPGHQKKLQESIIEICSASGGRAMVLFTSHSALQSTYRAIKRTLESRNILVLGQRIDGSPRQLIDRLKSNPRTIILGTNSFWEGVDIVGDALSLLVITKLPFPVPSDPVFAARSEQFEEPFAQYAVPQAILRFKQGFGRLIRSSNDRGACVVLDRRIVSRRYGDAFMNSLPSFEVSVGSTDRIALTVSDFLNRRNVMFGEDLLEEDERLEGME